MPFMPAPKRHPERLAHDAIFLDIARGMRPWQILASPPLPFSSFHQALRLTSPRQISSRILVVLYSMEKSLNRFGIAPDFDDLGLLNFVKMVIVSNQNRISIKTGCSVNNIR